MSFRFKSFSVFTFVLIAFGCAKISAQENNASSLSIKQIMQGDDFVGHLPSNVFWSLDGKKIYFNWNPEKAYSDSLYVYQLKDGSIKKVDFETSYNLPPRNAIYSKNKTYKAYSKEGDIYLVDLKKNSTIRVTNTDENEGNLQFVERDTKIAFNKGKNIYTWTISTGALTQITNFVEKKTEKTAQLNERDQWLRDDQLALFDVLRERKEKEDMRSKLNKRYDQFKRFEIDTKGQNVVGAKLSPNGKYVTYLTVKRVEHKGTIVPHYVTESGYTENQHTRSKVGDTPPEYHMYIYDIDHKKVYPVNFDNLEGLDYIPTYTKDYPDKPYKNENRIGSIHGPFWNSTGSMAILDIQSNDYKDRWIVSLNAADGTITNLNRQHDEAWIAGPAIGREKIGWMPDDKTIWFMSEKTGYAHLYTLNLQTKKVRALTQGKFEIYNPFISKDQSRWYFNANKNHPGDRQFYSMPLKGGELKPLTNTIGNHEVQLSPDEKYMAILYSYANKPTELYIKKNPLFYKNATKAKQITHSTTADFNAYTWKDPEIITFTARDGANVYARLYEPKSSIKNNAAIVFVHGAGYLQNAHAWWSSYFREYMFHNLLVDNGYTVLDIDYRGSAGYGRDWRTGIYRHMGGKDLTDQVDGVKMLIEKYGIDKEKVGIYGGSYGGFITLMAMFKESDTFKAGAAIRSVGDWAAYNHGYTARILNTPITDSLAYRRSSPIYFADGLKGNLLILHGMVDDNVHFQDMVRLSQRLIELGKHHWEMAIYPVERHGFVEASSWTDEYTRIFNLFQTSLLKIPVKQP
ncbi:prolyl oligopeptidase family serine peptidase [Flavobacteriaceae bacterium F08102]|nr:prolyl oligopeptidase family serine peptidase [Flavobacteriaceae bacterium F08102]